MKRTLATLYTSKQLLISLYLRFTSSITVTFQIYKNFLIFGVFRHSINKYLFGPKKSLFYRKKR